MVGCQYRPYGGHQKKFRMVGCHRSHARIHAVASPRARAQPGYCVEYAASNRSTCKGCKTKIDKGELRLGTITPGPGDYDMTAWRHLMCQKHPKGMQDPNELSGLGALRPEDQKKVRAARSWRLPCCCKCLAVVVCPRWHRCWARGIHHHRSRSGW